MVPLLLSEYEWRIPCFQPRMSHVLLRQDNLVRRHPPVYSQIRVVPGYRALGLRRVEVVALVLEHHLLAQHAEPVREAARDEELPVVLPRELDGHVPPEGRRPLPDVHRHVKDSTLYHPDQLRLRMRRLLEVQSPDDPVVRPALVVLHEMHIGHLLLELPLGERFEEIAAVIPEYPRLNDYRAVYRRLDYFHRLKSCIFSQNPTFPVRAAFKRPSIRFRPMACPVSGSAIIRRPPSLFQPSGSQHGLYPDGAALKNGR